MAGAKSWHGTAPMSIAHPSGRIEGCVLQLDEMPIAGLAHICYPSLVQQFILHGPHSRSTALRHLVQQHGERAVGALPGGGDQVAFELPLGRRLGVVGHGCLQFNRGRRARSATGSPQVPIAAAVGARAASNHGVNLLLARQRRADCLSSPAILARARHRRTVPWRDQSRPTGPR